MILLDSNIIIYAASEHHKSLRDLLKNYESCCSIISQLEVLGFPKITTEQTKFVTTQPVQRVHKQIFATDYADVTD